MNRMMAWAGDFVAMCFGTPKRFLVTAAVLFFITIFLYPPFLDAILIAATNTMVKFINWIAAPLLIIGLLFYAFKKMIGWK